MPFKDPQEQKDYNHRSYMEKREQRRAEAAAYYIENIESVKAKYDQTRSSTEWKEKRRIYLRENRERIAAKHREYVDRNRERLREWQKWYRIQKKFGISREDYERMASEQRGMCACCGNPPNHGKGKDFVVDHDHATGRVRALLCSRCNVAIGMLLESPELCEKAAAYLRRHLAAEATKAAV